MRRILVHVLLLGLAGLMIGCGSEPPAPGELTVTSEPPGAGIALDGVVTNQITPHTFLDLESGVTYAVTVGIDGWNPVEAKPVYLPPGDTAAADFELTQGYGSLQVTADLDGAMIVIDGTVTGEVTPHTFDELFPGDYDVTLQLEGFLSQPLEYSVNVIAYETVAVDFDMLQLPNRIVMLEGFSNVYCVGCPDMNESVNTVLHQVGYGPDRVLYVKWPAHLVALDPFYWVTQTITNPRVEWCFGSSGINLPSLTGDGSVLGLLGVPYGDEAITEYVDSQSEYASFEVIVETDEDLDDVADLSHDATVTLRSPGGVDLSDYILNVVLVYEFVTTENTGYIESVTEFHWVMRDYVMPSTDIGVLDAGVSYPFDITLDDPLGGELNGHAVFPDNKQIIAWVQHATTRDVLQAGSTVTATALQSAVSPAPNQGAPDAQSGGSR